MSILITDSVEPKQRSGVIRHMYIRDVASIFVFTLGNKFQQSMFRGSDVITKVTELANLKLKLLLRQKLTRKWALVIVFTISY